MAAPDIGSVIEAWIPRRSAVAIIDVPVHRNAGDLFILAAAARLLEDLGCRVVYSAGLRDYRTSAARRCITSETILVGLGGGNLGDLYPPYQALRERIIADFPDHRLVILPQTIHFQHDRARERATRLLAGHGDLRIAVRDTVSLEAARAFSPHTVLLPDLVDGLGETLRGARHRTGGTTARAAGWSGTLRLMRNDRERSGHGGGLDWPVLFPAYYGRVAVTAALMMAAPGPLSRALHERWRSYAGRLLARAISRLATAEHVITDRLHAAIVARIAGRPVTLLDNSYGKLAAYYDTWWRNDPGVTFQDTYGA